MNLSHVCEGADILKCMLQKPDLVSGNSGTQHLPRFWAHGQTRPRLETWCGSHGHLWSVLGLPRSVGQNAQTRAGCGVREAPGVVHTTLLSQVPGLEPELHKTCARHNLGSLRALESAAEWKDWSPEGSR